MAAKAENTAHWYVIQTHSRQEERAASNLKVLGISILSPRIKERRYNQFVITPTYIVKPFFPRYIFARFCLDNHYHKVRYSRGVYNVISFGGDPIPIDEDIITMIQTNIKGDGFIKINEDINPGDRVMIKEGPLKNFVGIFERETKDNDRVKILLETVSYQLHLEVERNLLKKSADKIV